MFGNIFYCPDCGKFETNFKFKNYKEERELVTWANCRDGYGSHITHIICPQCQNVLSGIMNRVDLDDEDGIWYAKTTIEMYNK